ncbi:MAG: DUF2764 family protein [Bacteroidales bacterium]|nr:DUF2764 family protein [Bacteroidales bacterium]
MSNFEYIVASLPFLTTDYKYEEGHNWDGVIEEIKENLSEKDTEVLDVLLDGFKEENLNPDFYARVLSHPVKFIRDYFRYDLNLRNAKVSYINNALGREAGLDIMDGKGGETDEGLDIDGYRFTGGEFREKDKVETALALSSLLDREQALDDVTWEVIDTLGTFHYFDITAVLCYVAKLHIVDRWLELDEERGREKFRQLVKEVRGTFKGVEYKEK